MQLSAPRLCDPRCLPPLCSDRSSWYQSMVKNGQACAVEGLSKQSIFGVNYANPKFPKLGIEWLRLSELLGRVLPGHFALPQRPGFHLLMLFTAGSGDHFLDFRRVRCKAGTLVH